METEVYLQANLLTEGFIGMNKIWIFIASPQFGGNWNKNFWKILGIYHLVCVYFVFAQTINSSVSFKPLLVLRAE